MEALSDDEAQALVDEGIIRIKYAMNRNFEVYAFHDKEYRAGSVEVNPAYLVMEATASEALMSVQSRGLAEHQHIYVSSTLEKSDKTGEIAMMLVASCQRNNLEHFFFIEAITTIWEDFVKRNAWRWV